MLPNLDAGMAQLVGLPLPLILQTASVMVIASVHAEGSSQAKENSPHRLDAPLPSPFCYSRSIANGYQGDARTAGQTSNSLDCENDGAKNTTMMLQLSTSNIMSWMTSLRVLWRIACVHCFDRSSALVRLSAKAGKMQLRARSSEFINNLG
jgi:hypothetical protein